jgi:hypothetical protein
VEIPGFEPGSYLVPRAAFQAVETYLSPKWTWTDSNRQPTECKSVALPIGATGPEHNREVRVCVHPLCHILYGIPTPQLAEVEGFEPPRLLHPAAFKAVYPTNGSTSREATMGIEPTHCSFADCRLLPASSVAKQLRTYWIDSLALAERRTRESNPAGL